MKVITGTIVSPASVIVDGNTVHFFSLMKAKRKSMEGTDEMYAPVFVEKPANRDWLDGETTPTKLALQLATLKEGTLVNVTVTEDGDIQVASQTDFGSRVCVSAIEILDRQASTPRGHRC